MLARTLVMLLGQWLIVSAFVWREGNPQFSNTLVVGLLCTAVAFVAVSRPLARRWNIALSAWLFASTLALPYEGAAMWSNLAVAVAIFALALVRGGEPARRLSLEERLRIVADAMERERAAQH